MSPEPPQEPRDPDDLSSTLHHVKNVQADDGSTSWANLHDKIHKWVHEAAAGHNLPADRSMDDLVQEVLMQVYRDIAEFEVQPDASFSGWVRTITQRKLHDFWRRERAQKRGRGRHKHLGDFDEKGGDDLMADRNAPRQSMYARWHELNDHLMEALKELSDKHKQVIELRLFQGRPFAEIAPRMGYTKEVTVRSLYMRALQRLQVLLADFA